jgi:Major Facilitator Superfamily
MESIGSSRFYYYNDYVRRSRQQALVTIESSDIQCISNNNYNNNRKYGNNSTIDIKGAITLAITITSFLLVLTYLERGNSSSSANNSSVVSGSTIQISGFVTTGVVSLLLFILIERRSANPLIDFRLLLHKSILPSNLIIMVVGFSTFMIFQTVPIILRNPSSLGFGENAVNAGNIVLPFALVFLVFGPTSGYIITKLGSLKPIIFGSIITTVGFFGLLVFHSTEFSISTSLAILATGFSLTIVGVMNVVVLSTPKQYSGISLGTTMLMRIVGSAIGPAKANLD